MGIKLTKVLLNREDKEINKKIKRKVKTKKNVPKEEISEDQEENPESCDVKPHNNVVEDKDEEMQEVDIQQTPEATASNVEEIVEEPQPTKKPDMKRTKFKEEKVTGESVNLPTLKPTKTNKPKIIEAEREVVQLKHHEFESKPLETDEEKCSSIQLGSPIEVKPNKVKKIPKVKPKPTSKVPDP